MHKNFRTTTPRQRKLQFEDDDNWERLDPSARGACQALVTQLLLQVFDNQAEPTRQPRSEDERQD